MSGENVLERRWLKQKYFLFENISFHRHKLIHFDDLYFGKFKAGDFSNKNHNNNKFKAKLILMPSLNNHSLPNQIICVFARAFSESLLRRSFTLLFPSNDRIH